MSEATAQTVKGGTAATGVLRRWIVYAIAYTLLTMAANGSANIISWLFDTDPNKNEYTWGMANWLAYTFIAGPLAVLLLWYAWRRLDHGDRNSYAWPIYLTVVYATSLVVFTFSLFTVLSAFVTSSSRPLDAIGGVISWGVVWVIHRWMLRHKSKHPLRLATLSLILGFGWGLAVAAFNAVRVLQILFEQAFSGPDSWQVGAAWWTHLLGALIWTLGGLVIWWWHWHREGVKSLRGGFADVAILIGGVFAAAVASLTGIGTLLSLGMRALWDSRLSDSDLASGASFAISIIAVATPIWLYHRRAAKQRAEETRIAVRLIESGIGIIGMAAGLGVVVNAALASITSPLSGPSGGGALTLLFQGIAAMLVGGVAWFWAWKPHRLNDGLGVPARRVYLVVIFGVSAIAAVSALITIGYRIFAAILEDGGNIVDLIRAPLGVLIATALVFGYHFAIWRRDRALVPDAETPGRRIGQLTFVGHTDDAEFARAVSSATGAKVTVWHRADGADSAATSAAVVSALEGVSAHRVLVIAGAKNKLEVIALAD